MAQIKITFSVFGDSLIPENLSTILNYEPTNYWYKGDFVPIYKGLNNKGIFRTRKENAWELVFGPVQTLFFSDALIDFSSWVTPRLEVLTQYVNENSLFIKLFVLIEAQKDEFPGIFIDKNLMAIMVKLNGEIDFDIYIFDE